MVVMKKRITSLLLILSALLAVGCSPFYDDLSQCKSNYLVFSYHADDDATQEHIHTYVHAISLFIYDEAGKLVQRHRLNQEALDRENGLALDLPIGTYRAVAVGNALEHTSIVAPDLYGASALVQHASDADRQNQSFDPLYLGECPIKVEASAHHRDVLTLYSEHIEVKAQVVCADAEVRPTWFAQHKEHTYQLEMAPLSRSFPLTAAAGATRTGVRAGSTLLVAPFTPNATAMKMDCRFTTLRFSQEDPIFVTLYEEGEEKCRVDLARYLADGLAYCREAEAHQQNYYNPFFVLQEGKVLQEALLPITFYQNPITLQVKLPSWRAIEVQPIL